jgi:hypothetical protein
MLCLAVVKEWTPTCSKLAIWVTYPSLGYAGRLWLGRVHSTWMRTDESRTPAADHASSA